MCLCAGVPASMGAAAPTGGFPEQLFNYRARQQEPKPGGYKAGSKV